MEKTYYYLYQITCKLNGKIYIGVHKTNNLNDGYMGSGIILNRLIKSYGLENFEKIILEHFNNSNEMYSRESEIVTSEFIKREDVLNLREGGNGWSGDTARKAGIKGSKLLAQRQSQKGSKNSQYGTCCIYRIVDNGKEKKRINKNDLKIYLNDGWLKIDHNPPIKFCTKCNKKLGYRNKSGLCKECNKKYPKQRYILDKTNNI